VPAVFGSSRIREFGRHGGRPYLIIFINSTLNFMNLHMWGYLKKERRTSNIERPTSNNVFCQFKKKLSNPTPRSGYEGRERIHSSKLCGSLVIKSIKRSVINIGCSMLDVRCSTFNAYSPPVEDSLFRIGVISYEVSYE